MKKKVIMCLLAMMSVGGVSCAYAQSDNNSTSVSTAAASKSIRELCEGIDMALAKYKENPSDLQNIGADIDKRASELDPKQKLNAADKALLKKTMHNLMEIVVSTQMEQNPQMAAMFGRLTDEQKKEMLRMAMEVDTQQIDSRIDACETLEDFANLDM